MTEVSMEGCILDMMPYEILFEIFRELSKGKLIEISRLSLKFREVAGDTRLWKNVFIKHKDEQTAPAGLAFEDLYSEPWPVKVIDLSCIKIRPPVSFKTDQEVKVTKLNLLSTKANKDTVEAVLAKYQCTELYMDNRNVDLEGHIVAIAPEAFIKQTALELLSLRGIHLNKYDVKNKAWKLLDFFLWLPRVLKNCKHLKTLDLSIPAFNDCDQLNFVKSLPTSLEKLSLSWSSPENPFFELLAKRIPNLKELGLCHTKVKCPALLKFQYLDALCIVFLYDFENINKLCSNFCKYLLKFPALKTVYADTHACKDFQKPIIFENLRAKLEPHGIIVRQIKEWPYSEDGDLWHSG